MINRKRNHDSTIEMNLSGQDNENQKKCWSRPQFQGNFVKKSGFISIVKRYRLVFRFVSVPIRVVWSHGRRSCVQACTKGSNILFTHLYASLHLMSERKCPMQNKDVNNNVESRGEKKSRRKKSAKSKRVTKGLLPCSCLLDHHTYVHLGDSS